MSEDASSNSDVIIIFQNTMEIKMSTDEMLEKREKFSFVKLPTKSNTNVCNYTDVSGKFTEVL
jgi:hypothetical protein